MSHIEGSASRSNAFTLAERLIVMVILGVLAAVTIPRFTVSAAEGKKAACANNCAIINEAVERWYFTKGVWPDDDLNDIENDPDYFPNGTPLCPINGQKYKLDPTTHRVTDHDH